MVSDQSSQRTERDAEISRPDARTTVPLSRKQMRTLRIALEEGYFEVPRGIRLKDLADEVGCSHQALSERLRVAMNDIVTALIRTDPIADTPKWSSSVTENAVWYHHDSNCPRLLGACDRIKQVSESAAEYHELEPCPECIAARSLWIETATGDK